jgi:hypothetical protein
LPILPGLPWIENVSSVSDIEPVIAPYVSGLVNRTTGTWTPDRSNLAGQVVSLVEPNDPCLASAKVWSVGQWQQAISPEVLARARYERYMQIGGGLMREGRPSEAVEAYTMALVYSPADPLAMAAKAHALFADGQFFTSGLFLSRTLEICPDYLMVKVDLPGLLGELLQARLDRLRRLATEDGSAQLRLLLGYVLYRISDIGQARDVLESIADTGLPGVRAMKRAIEQSTGP